MSEDSLPVELYGTVIGHLYRVNGQPAIEWAPEGLNRWGERSAALSHSLLLGSKVSSEAVNNFFGALLPEGIWLSRLSTAVGVGERDIVGLFKHVGRDLAGALTVGEAQRMNEDPEPLDTAQVRRLLDNASGFIVGGGGSALPGYQRKIALTRLDGQWASGHGSIASTHILKPARAEDERALHCEDYTIALARTIGLSNFDTWVEDIGGAPTLVIERYDRKIVGGDVQRLHQEDTAQALSLPWHNDSKFERYDSRANLRAIAGLLDADRPVFDKGEADVERLLRYITFTVAVGNTDAHAKNFSIIKPESGRPLLAPLYDAAPISLSYDGRRELAMLIAGESYQPNVTKDHLVSEALAWGVSENRARGIVNDTLDHITEATRTVPAHPSIAAQVPGFIRQQSRNLAAGDPAGIKGAVPPSLIPVIGTPGPAAE